MKLLIKRIDCSYEKGITLEPLRRRMAGTNCDQICDQATLGIAEKRPIQIGFGNRQAAQVVDLN
jgi:hypothetical protein